MVLNYIWIAFFLIAFVVALMRLVFLGDTQVFPEIINSTFNSSKTAFEISLGLTGVLSLWLGIMRIGEQGGVITLFSRLLGPLFSKLFPDIPKGHPVTGSIFMNLAANMLGLDNAATPLGLKAMEGLQELNSKKDTASNPMIMFLVLNTSAEALQKLEELEKRSDEENRRFLQKGVEEGFFLPNINFQLMDDIVRIIKDQTVFYQQYGIKTVWTTLVRVFLRSICTLKGVQELDAFLDKMATEDGAFSPV